MIERLKTLKVNFALVAFSCFIIKMIAFDASIADSIIVIALGSLYGYTQHLQKFQVYKIDEAIAKDLLEVKSAMSKMNLLRVTEKSENKRYF